MIPVSWCVDRTTLELLSSLGITDPYVLLITAPQGAHYSVRKETRQLVPLKDGMAYVNFRTDGPNRIHAMLMFWWSGINGVHEFVLGQEGGHWNTSLLTHDGLSLAEHLNTCYQHGNRKCGWGIVKLPKTSSPEKEAEEGWEEDEVPEWYQAISANLDVIVPKGVFAKPPPAWEAAWVNHWFRYAPVDQCDYRKRRLWAYSIQPPCMLINWLLRLTITLLATLAGFKRVSWKPIRHLLSMSIDDVLANFLNGNYFWPRSWSRNLFGLVARIGLPVFSPLSLLVIALISWALEDGFTDRFLATFLLISGGIAIGVPLVIGVFVLVCLGIVGIYNKLKDGSPEKVPLQRADYLEPDTVDFLSCDTAGSTTRTLAQIPWRRRSVRLILQAAKAEVCRPFAR